MQRRFSAICAAGALTFLLLTAARADVVVLSSGERFTSDRVWEEGGKVRFNMQGLIVSVDRAEVAAVIPGAAPAAAAVQPPVSLPVPAAQQPASPERPQPPPASPAEPPLLSLGPDAPKPASPAPQTEPAAGIGWQGLAWMMTPAEIPGLQKSGSEPSYGGIDQYWRPDQTARFGAVPLDGVVYAFWHNQLYAISAWVDGRSGYERLEKEFYAVYGPGHPAKSVAERYLWSDAASDRLLEFDTKLNTGILWMRSRKLDAEIKRLYPEP